MLCVGDVETVGISYANWLRTGELLTGTPTVVEVNTTALTLDNKAINTAAVEILGEQVAIGKAVQFRVAGGATGRTYSVTITVSTNATAPRTIVRTVDLTWC